MNVQIFVVMVATLAPGVLMMVSGVEQSLLEWRRPPRTCPSCGRQLRNGRSCSCTH